MIIVRGFNPVVKAINEIEKLNKYRFEKFIQQSNEYMLLLINFDEYFNFTNC